MQVAILIFDGITALDAIGPYEVLAGVPGASIRFVSKESGPKRTDSEALALIADHSLDEITSPDILLVPGGQGNRLLFDDREVLSWLQDTAKFARWTTSVCTGSLLLGAAGLLEGKRATSHWLFLERLREYGATPVSERVVEDGKLITAAGVSSGIDMALRLVSHEAGPEIAQAVQLAIEYDPDPPFDAGTPSKAPPALVDAVSHTLLQREQMLLERDQSQES
jgi:transcriptional regulator GlxA family with amidase domain